MTEDPVGPRNPNGERRYILHRSALAASLADATGAASGTRVPESPDNAPHYQSSAHLAMAAAAAAAADAPRVAAPPAAPPAPVPAAPATTMARPVAPAPSDAAPSAASAEGRRRSSLARLNVSPMAQSTPVAPVAPSMPPSAAPQAAPQATVTSTLPGPAPAPLAAPSEMGSAGAGSSATSLPTPAPTLAPAFPAAPAMRAWRPSDDDILPHRAVARGSFRMRRRPATKG